MATLIGLKRGTTNITVSYTEGGTTKTGSKSNFVVEGLPGTPPTFSNKSVSAQLVPTTATNSPAVNCGAFTAATAGHGGSITYSIVSVKNSGGTTLSGWTLTTTTSRIIKVPASTAGGTYTAVVRATEGPTDTYAESSTTATITITVNKKSQNAPTATGAQNTYATSGSISGSASGGGGIGSLKYKSDPNGGTNYGTATTTAPSRSRSSVGSTSFVAWWTGNDYWAQSGNSDRAYLIIGKATPTFTLTGETKEYHNTANVTGTASIGGTVYWGTSSSTSSMTSTKTVTAGSAVTISSRTALGTTTVYAYFVPTDSSHYDSLGSSTSAHASGAAVISKATDASVAVSINSNDLTYNGSNQTLATMSTSHGTSSYQIGYKLGSSATSDNQITWANSNVATIAASTAGTYYLYKKWTADGNHSNNQAYTTIGTTYTKVIDKAENPITLAPSTATIYNRSGYNTVQLSVTNAQGTVSYTTSSSGKATVNSTGLVTYASSGSATITATAAGNTNYLSGSKTCAVTTVVDTEGTTKYKNEACTTEGSNITYNNPTVTISTGLTAAATSAKVTCTVTNSTSWYQKWASGYVSAHSSTLAGTARWKITSNGSNRFTASGTSYTLSGVGTVYANGASVKHSTMGSYVGTDSVTVTAYNISSSTKTSTSTKSVTNELLSIAITLGSDTINYDDTTSMTVKASYTSGLSTHDITSAATISTNPSNIITITI